MAKKDFTKADGAVDRLFTRPEHTNNTKYTNVLNNTNNTKHTNDTNIDNNTKVTNVKNKSKHYDDRGPRNERFGLLMDAKLKDDLNHLAKIDGSKSINDLIVTILVEHMEKEGVQEKLIKFKSIFNPQSLKYTKYTKYTNVYKHQYIYICQLLKIIFT